MQFIVSVLELWARLKSLNASLVNTLSCLGEPTLSQLLLGWQQKEPHEELNGKLRRLQHVHLLLQRAAELLQAHVSPAITFHVVYSVLGTIYSSYEVLVTLVAPEQVESVLVTPSLSFTACWLVRHVFELVALTFSCSALQDQEAQAATLLRRAAGLTGEEPEMKAFLNQLERGPTLRFTASGLLPIDRRLLVSAVSATVTYLVVLGQLGLNSSSSGGGGGGGGGGGV
ncbi:putative gustatory receptor 28b [Schistocerca americana]|uniref:putative gustatory receptor 28b n=1 Tax=Schistocerca americana TaxID=7009 RepID=UPI001F4F8C9E|nr:putative gustatory receptor 28b [Schistocerca americana]